MREPFRVARRGGRVTGISETREAPDAVVESDFDEMFPELFRSAYRVAYRLLGSREDAADCAQEACARACADWPKLTRTGSPVPWVVRVSSNLAIDRWRRAQRTRGRASAAVAVFDPDPERLDLYRALDALPRRQRDVVVLRYFADLSETAVAETLGCSVGTVKSNASRARAALRAVLTIEEEPS
jgi:RNA polymerase sigma-70 factor (sigma-E family)